MNYTDKYLLEYRLRITKHKRFSLPDVRPPLTLDAGFVTLVSLREVKVSVQLFRPPLIILFLPDDEIKRESQRKGSPPVLDPPRS